MKKENLETLSCKATNNMIFFTFLIYRQSKIHTQWKINMIDNNFAKKKKKNNLFLEHLKGNASNLNEWRLRMGGDCA